MLQKHSSFSEISSSGLYSRNKVSCFFGSGSTQLLLLAFIICWLVLEYYCWYTANAVTISVFNALSIEGGLVAAVALRIKRGIISETRNNFNFWDIIWSIHRHINLWLLFWNRTRVWSPSLITICNENISWHQNGRSRHLSPSTIQFHCYSSNSLPKF